jgi:hypothetical protein
MSVSRDFIDPYSPEAPQHRGLQDAPKPATADLECARLLNHAMTGECDWTTLVFGFRYKLHLVGEDCRRTPFSQPAVADLGTLEGRFSGTPEIGCRAEMTARRPQSKPF